MTGLLYKNFRVNFYSFIAMIASALLCCAFAMVFSIIGERAFGLDIATLFIILTYYCAFIIPGITSTFLFEADEGRAASSFAMSIPQGAKGHIESKYWYILIQNLTVLFIAFIADAITYGILEGRFTATIILVLIFCWRLLLSAVETPFVIRFGSQKGLEIKSLIITFVVFLGLIYFLFGDISWLINSKDPVRALFDLVQSGKITFALSLFPFISIAAYWLSCRISVKVFRKGAENYEQ